MKKLFHFMHLEIWTKVPIKSDRQAVRQEFIFVKRIARFVFGRSVRLPIGYLHIHDCF